MDSNPEWVDKFIASDRNKTLSRKDRRVLNAMRQSVLLTPEEQAIDLEDSLSESNLQDLANTIRTTKNQQIRAVLLEEQNRLMNLLSEPALKPVQVSTPPQKDESILDTVGNLLSRLYF